MNLQGRYIYANVEAQRVFSRSLEALVGRTDQEIFDAETARQFRDNDFWAHGLTAGVEIKF